METTVYVFEDAGWPGWKLTVANIAGNLRIQIEHNENDLCAYLEKEEITRFKEAIESIHSQIEKEIKQ